MDPHARAAKFPLTQSRRRPGVVEYGHLNAAEAHFHDHLHRLLEAGAKRICDMGGGARPTLSLEQIRRHGLEYVVFDESAAQLGKAGDEYRVVAGNALDRSDIDALRSEHGPFDAVVSRWTAEHMPSGRTFHEHVFRLLRPGGTAVHFFPTLFAIPFVVNRLVSERAARALLRLAMPGRQNKWPAYYSWCRGPSEPQLRRLEGLGYEIEYYAGFFGHVLYAPLPPLHRAEQLWAQVLARHPQPALTSFALAVLRRPDPSGPTSEPAATTIVA